MHQIDKCLAISLDAWLIFIYAEQIKTCNQNSRNNNEHRFANRSRPREDHLAFAYRF